MENHFSENLPILRRKAGHTQETLAEELGVSRQAVGKWEKGKTMPEANTLLTLAGLLGCSLDTLMLETLSRESISEPEPSGEELIKPEPEQAEDAAAFEAYNACMDRVAAMMGLGVGAIPVAIGNMIFLMALGFPEGASVGIILMGIAAAVSLIVFSGLKDEAFQEANPYVPDLYTERERFGFQRIFHLGCTGAVTAILADVAVFVFLGAILEGHERLSMALLGIFLFVLGLAIGTLTFLGLLSRKYEVEKGNGKRILKQARENG